jgi:hypothetical protein
LAVEEEAVLFASALPSSPPAPFRQEKETDVPIPEIPMPRDPQVLIYAGIRDVVVALDSRSGAEVWRAELRSNDYVTVYFDGESLLAANAGEVWCLDPERGTLIWHNELKGMGRGLVSLASSRRPGATTGSDLAAEKRRRDAQAAASAAT